MIVPKSRRTHDPEYKRAKTTLKHYVFDSTNLLASIHQLSENAQKISKFYLQFCSMVTGWYPNATPSVRQSLNTINQSAERFDQITTDRFINSIVPNFEQSMRDYKKQLDDLLILEKNRKKAVNSLDRNKEKLRKAQCAAEPDYMKINQLQRKVEASESTYNTTNNNFISAVNNFTEPRKDDIQHLLKKCIFNITEYINEVTQLSFIKFPDDINSPPVVDPKSVDNNDDKVQHINQSQPILPPACSINGQQMPIYVQNNYAQSTQVMNGYGYFQGQMNIQPSYQGNQSQGVCYYNNIPPNQQHIPAYDVDPSITERAAPSSPTTDYSDDSDIYDNEGESEINSDDDIKNNIKKDNK